jgi:hypothetical protein
MSDAPLSASPSPLAAVAVFETFRLLCIETGGDFETSLAAAALRGLEPFSAPMPPRPDVVSREALAQLRQPGYFFTVSRYLTGGNGRPLRRMTESSVVARPASFEDVSAVLTRALGAPTVTVRGRRVEFVYLTDPGGPALPSRADGWRRLERGEGELVEVAAWDVREHQDRPGDAVSLSYLRWTL